MTIHKGTVYYKDACQSMLAALPGFPYMLDEAAQGDESYLLAEIATQTDSPGDWEIAAIDEGCSEFAAEWEHSGRP